MERELKVAPLSYSRRSPPGVGGVGGEGNYWVPVYADKKGKYYPPQKKLDKLNPEMDKLQHGRLL